MKKHFLLLLMAFMSMTAWAQLDISGATVQFDGPGLFTYNGSAQTIPIKVKMPNASSEIGAANYDVVYYAADGTTSVTAANVKNAGDYFVAAKGKESAGYTGETAKVAFTINRLLMSNGAITVTPTPTVADASFSYDGTEKKFTSVAVKFGETVLVENTDYTISYKDNILAGTNTAKLVVTGKGNFQGDNETKFSITAANLPATTVAGAYTFTALTTNPVYTGVETATLPKLVVKDGEKTLVEGTDYEIRWYDATGVLSKTVAGKTVYTKPVNAGTFTAKVFGKGGYAEGSGITGTSPAWTLTIDQAPITAILKDATPEYSGSNQANQSTYAQTKSNWEFSGIVSADAANATVIKNQFVVSAATAKYMNGTALGTAIVPGNYTLTLDGVTISTETTEPFSATGAALAANYRITLTDGKLAIGKKELKLKAKPASKNVGEADPEFELATTAGLYDGADGKDAIQGVTFTRAAGEDPEVSYPITPDFTAATVKRTKGTTVSDVTDYYKFALDTEKGALTINKGGILVTIKDAEKFYGQADPEKFEYTVVGLQDGDELPAFTISRSEGEEVGTYSLTATVTNPKPEKYSTLNVSNGIFTIKKAHLTITLPAQNLKKNNLVTALKKDDIKVTGINNDDKAEDLYTLLFNSEGEGAIPSSALTTGGAINVDNATYSNGYKLTLNSAVAPATKGAIDRYDILVNFDAATETATYASAITGKIIVGAGTGGGALVLDLDDAATNNLANIQGAVGETRTVKIALNRAQTIGGAEHNWKKGIWNCMVLPFKTSARQISKALGYAIVNVVNPSETTEGNVKFKLEMLEEIPANTPIFVKTDADLSALNAGTAVFENVKIEAPESAYPSVLASSEAIGYKFVGAYTKKTITGNNEEHLRWRLGDNNAWNKIGNGSTATWDIVPFNAYMDLGATAGAREIVFTFEEIDGTTTSIRSIDIDNVGNAKVSANGWYTLGGVKLNGAPTQKGVYIQDGKKVVIK